MPLNSTPNSSVVAEWVDNGKELKWRLVQKHNGLKPDEKSEWCSWYQGVFTHRFKDRTVWAFCTEYWAGTLPVETPFQIMVPETFKATNEQ